MNGNPGIRYRCAGAEHPMCTRGTGKPRRQECTFCGRVLVVERGWWTVQEWRSEGHYTLDSAVKVYRTPAHANRYVEKAWEEECANLVVRFVCAE